MVKLVKPTYLKMEELELDFQDDVGYSERMGDLLWFL